MALRSTSQTMRIWHRYLGYFLAGIMAMYAISGTIMIFRNTDFLKSEKQIEKQIDAGLAADALGPALRLRDLKVERTENNILYFKEGQYNSQTGLAQYRQKELPFVLQKMTQLHKATSDKPLFFLNVFFGVSLLFFVLSAFWMFLPKTKIFKKGLYFTLAGIVLTLIMLFV